MQSPQRSAILVGLIALLLAAVAIPASAGPRATQDVVVGQLSEFAAGIDRGYDISGPVRLTVGEEWTQVRVNARGLAADTTYGSHLHESACDDGNGGGHYMDDPDSDVEEPPNELWLSIETNAAGNGHDASSAPWRVRDGARSVVIHDTDGARIACADLPVPEAS